MSYLTYIGFFIVAGSVFGCEDGWTKFESNCYKAFKEEVDFSTAEGKCNSFGGHVTSIHSVAENDFISKLNSASKLWVGATWTGKKWVWKDGTSWEFTHWWFGEPNDPNKEPCIGQWKDRKSKWNDVKCSSRDSAFVCKVSANTCAFWKQTSGRATMVGVGPDMVWVVNKDDKIYKLEQNGNWKQTGGRLKGISVGAKTVWGVNATNHIYYDSAKPGVAWNLVDGLLRQVSVSGFNDDVVWGVNRDRDIFQRTKQSGWKKIDGTLVQVSAGQAGVWGVNKLDEVFYRQGTYGGAQSAGSRWKRVDGLLTWVSSGADGEVWGVNKEMMIWRRRGVSVRNPIGTSWERITGPNLKQVSIYGGRVWGVDSADNIYHTTMRCESGGWCLDRNGNDQNSGTIQLGRVSNKLDCWSKCKSRAGAKGCEYHQSTKRCGVHTNDVSRGGGSKVSDFTCLVL